MSISVDKKSFIQSYDSGNAQVIWDELPYETATPTSATLALK